ncbi:MAG: polysaccharide biosynthesis C-terminal domain-containing protein, partial [Clostridium sp.]|nr:polysaccharide biosynthesis C-terminal domain-containing protein [Clostridium sp.]
FICLLNAVAIRRAIRYRQEMVKTFVIPAVSAALMGVVAYFTYRGVTLVLHSNLMGTLISVIVAVVVYAVLLIRLHGIEASELKSMPGGTRLLGLCRKLHLM